MPKYPCPNPNRNPGCGQTTAKKDGLCRSCGIRAGKARQSPGSTPPRPAAAKPTAPATAAGEEAVTIGPMPRHLADVLLVAARAVITGAKVESPEEGFRLGQASAYLQAALAQRN